VGSDQFELVQTRSQLSLEDRTWNWTWSSVLQLYRTCDRTLGSVREGSGSNLGSGPDCGSTMCYLPLSHPCDQLDEEYILQIMSFEYGSAVLEQLGHRTLSQSDKRKIARREHKIELAIEA
jgi:hypothetical protein